jgi:hypothetical protein
MEGAAWPRTLEDVFGYRIEVTEERRRHSIAQHPEIAPYLEEIAGTLLNPDLVKKSLRDESVWLYYRFFDTLLDGKYILVVVKVNDRRFALTAFITDYIRKGEMLWPSKS